MKVDLLTNFLPIAEKNYTFFANVKECNNPNEKKPQGNVRRFWINNSLLYITFDDANTFIKRSFNINDNKNLTLWNLFNKICENCKQNNLEYITDNKFQEAINVIINRDAYGKEIISVIPKYIISLNKYGFMINYRFQKANDIPFSTEVQKRSLSLDIEGKQNKNYYIDKYNKLKNFINFYFDKIFVFETDDLIVQPRFEYITANQLETKKYEFGNSKSAISQFIGIKNNGPFNKINLSDEKKPCICFVYRNHEKIYSYKLYRALEGVLYSTFTGMEKMFGYPLNKTTVIGVGVDDYKKSDILNLISTIKTQVNNHNVVPIFLVPWSRETATEEQEELYFYIKYQLLMEKIASQFIDIKKVINDNNLKWTTASLAVQLFSKLGGSPWRVIPKTSKCLIIGLGQSYQMNHDKTIKRFLSYSILTDSSGLFRDIRILADNNNEDQYINNLKKNLREIISDYKDTYNHFVVHTTFRIKKNDIEAIQKLFDELQNSYQCSFAVLRFDMHHDYLCFDTNCNSLIPYESTKVELSPNSYLIWFEGQQYGNKLIDRRIGSPVKINIDYPKQIDQSLINNYLQDAVNLSGANWRGFNAKTIPISILYSKLISIFISAFNKYNLKEISIENLTPWFL